MAQIFNPSMNPMGMMGAQYNPAISQPSTVPLYVGNIDKDIDVQKLYDYFSSVVKPESIQKVDLKKEITGESRGFAYITFKDHTSAARAKNVFNHSKIKENVISVAFVRRGTDLSPNANLFFKNLNKEFTSKELEELCASYGTILSCKLRYDENGRSLGYGYVQFEKDTAAQDCKEALNKKNIKEHVIEVDHFKPKNQRQTVNQRCNLYLKQFPDSWTEKQIEEFISNQLGKGREIQSKAIAKDQKIGKYYSFVAFRTAEQAQEAVRLFNEHDFGGENTRLYADFAQSREQRRKLLKEKHKNSNNETNLFVKSLAAGVTETDLRTVFEKEFGEVTSVCVKTHELGKFGAPTASDKKSLKFGFVNFKNQSDAEKAYKDGKKSPAVLALIDPTHYSNVDIIYYAQPKVVRNQYLKIQIKNKKTSSALQQNMKLYQQLMEKMMKTQQPTRPAGPYQKKPIQQGQRKGADQMNMQGFQNPFMFQQMAMNPQMMQMYQAQQVVSV